MKEVNDVHSSVRAHMATGLTDLPGQWLQCQASGAQTVSGVEAAVRRSDEGLDQRAHQHLLTCSSLIKLINQTSNLGSIKRNLSLFEHKFKRNSFSTQHTPQ
jgi:hypothetical protein